MAATGDAAAAGGVFDELVSILVEIGCARAETETALLSLIGTLQKKQLVQTMRLLHSNAESASFQLGVPQKAYKKWTEARGGVAVQSRVIEYLSKLASSGSQMIEREMSEYDLKLYYIRTWKEPMAEFCKLYNCDASRFSEWLYVKAHSCCESAAAVRALRAVVSATGAVVGAAGDAEQTLPFDHRAFYLDNWKGSSGDFCRIHKINHGNFSSYIKGKKASPAAERAIECYSENLNDTVGTDAEPDLGLPYTGDQLRQLYDRLWKSAAGPRKSIEEFVHLYGGDKETFSLWRRGVVQSNDCCLAVMRLIDQSSTNQYSDGCERYDERYGERYEERYDERYYEQYEVSHFQRTNWHLSDDYLREFYTLYWTGSVGVFCKQYGLVARHFRLWQLGQVENSEAATAVSHFMSVVPVGTPVCFNGDGARIRNEWYRSWPHSILDFCSHVGMVEHYRPFMVWLRNHGNGRPMTEYERAIRQHIYGESHIYVPQHSALPCLTAVPASIPISSEGELLSRSDWAPLVSALKRRAEHVDPRAVLRTLVFIDADNSLGDMPQLAHAMVAPPHSHSWDDVHVILCISRLSKTTVADGFTSRPWVSFFRDEVGGPDSVDIEIGCMAGSLARALPPHVQFTFVSVDKVFRRLAKSITDWTGRTCHVAFKNDGEVSRIDPHRHLYWAERPPSMLSGLDMMERLRNAISINPDVHPWDNAWSDRLREMEDMSLDTARVLSGFLIGLDVV
jgi:hypothetical protein